MRDLKSLFSDNAELFAVAALVIALASPPARMAAGFAEHIQQPQTIQVRQIRARAEMFQTRARILANRLQRCPVTARAISHYE
jgi:hypothetical protein